MTAVVERGGSAAPQRATRASVLVVVSDPRVRGEVAGRLRMLGTQDVVETGTVAEARRLAALSPPGLVVLDVALPDGSGLRLLADLRRTGLARAIVMSSHDDPHTVRAALASGVRGYLTSRQRPRALTAVADPAPSTRGRTGPDGLSAREVEVLRLVADGQSNRDVGTSLGLSSLTVKSHLARIGRKLGSGDRAEMVALSLRAGILT